MASGTLLSTLLAMTKAKALIAAESNTILDAELSLLLSMQQQWFATQYDWKALRLPDGVDVLVPPNSRYLNLPTNIDFTRPTPKNELYVKWEDLWNPVYEGISISDFNEWDSDRGQTSDPIQRWQPYGALQFEIWPMNQTPQTVRFYGQKRLAALVQPTDTADLDDLLLVLYVAGEYLARTKNPLAQLTLASAQAQFNTLRLNEPRGENPSLCGKYLHNKDNRKFVGVKIIATK